MLINLHTGIRGCAIPQRKVEARVALLPHARLTTATRDMLPALLTLPHRQTKEERLYGVFAEDFDDDGGGGHSGGRGKHKAPASKRGGMMFVKSGGTASFGMSG